MANVVRVVLRTTSILTFGMAGWLVAVIASGGANRGQDLAVLWSIVAVGSTVLATLSILATRGPRLTQLAAGALVILGVAGTAFGLFVLSSEMTSTLSGDPEGYLLAIGTILTLNGALALGWLVVRSIGLAR